MLHNGFAAIEFAVLGKTGLRLIFKHEFELHEVTDNKER